MATGGRGGMCARMGTHRIVTLIPCRARQPEEEDRAGVTAPRKRSADSCLGSDGFVQQHLIRSRHVHYSAKHAMPRRSIPARAHCALHLPISPDPSSPRKLFRRRFRLYVKRGPRWGTCGLRTQQWAGHSDGQRFDSSHTYAPGAFATKLCGSPCL